MNNKSQSIPQTSGIYRNNKYNAKDGGVGGGLGNPEVSGHHLPLTGKYGIEKEMDEYCRLQQYPNDHLNLQTALHMASPLLAYDNEYSEDISHYQQDRQSKQHSKQDKGGAHRAMLTNNVVGTYTGDTLPLDRSLADISRNQDVGLNSYDAYVGRKSQAPSYIQAPQQQQRGRQEGHVSDSYVKHLKQLANTAQREKSAITRLQNVGGYANAGFAPGRTLDAVSSDGKVVTFRPSNNNQHNRPATAKSRKYNNPNKKRLTPGPRVTATHLDVHSRVIASNITSILGEQSDTQRTLQQDQSASTSRVRDQEHNLALAQRAAEEEKERGDKLEQELLYITQDTHRNLPSSHRRSISPTEALYARMLREAEGRECTQLPIQRLTYTDPSEDDEPVDGQPLNRYKYTPSAHQTHGSIRPDHAAISMWAEATPRIDYDTALWSLGDGTEDTNKPRI